MMFEVVAPVWDYRPRRCTMVSYRKGERGFLPEDVVRKAEADGFVRILEDQPDA